MGGLVLLLLLFLPFARLRPENDGMISAEVVCDVTGWPWHPVHDCKRVTRIPYPPAVDEDVDWGIAYIEEVNNGDGTYTLVAYACPHSPAEYISFCATKWVDAEGASRQMNPVGCWQYGFRLYPDISLQCEEPPDLDPYERKQYPNFPMQLVAAASWSFMELTEKHFQTRLSSIIPQNIYPRTFEYQDSWLPGATTTTTTPSTTLPTTTSPPTTTTPTTTTTTTSASTTTPSTTPTPTTTTTTATTKSPTTTTSTTTTTTRSTTSTTTTTTTTAASTTTPTTTMTTTTASTTTTTTPKPTTTTKIATTPSTSTTEATNPVTTTPDTSTSPSTAKTPPPPGHSDEHGGDDDDSELSFVEIIFGVCVCVLLCVALTAGIWMIFWKSGREEPRSVSLDPASVSVQSQSVSISSEASQASQRSTASQQTSQRPSMSSGRNHA